jgi:hypothetical protein
MPKRNRSKKMRGGLFGYFEGKEEKPANGSTSEKGWMDSATSMFSSEPTPPTPPPSSNSFSPPANNPYPPPANKPYPLPANNPYPPRNSYSSNRPRNSYSSNKPKYSFGGKVHRRKSHKMKGGYSDNVSMTNLASHAAPFSGVTARPQAYVGGRRSKRRCHTHKRSRRRHCRK